MEPRPKKGHRRLGSRGHNVMASFAMESGPMSTTKALLVSVNVPCFVATSKESVDETSVSTMTADMVPDDYEDQPQKRHRKPKRGAAMGDFLLSEDDEDKAINALLGLSNSPMATIHEKKKAGSSTTENPTAEEAAHVIASNNSPDESEVNVEALLRLTLKNLLEEWHLLTIPTYTRADRQREVVPSTQAEDSAGWLQVQFMVRPTSLATVLDRMERIGVGCNCGSLTVYKAELCRTTSSYANSPLQTDNEQSNNNKLIPDMGSEPKGMEPKVEDIDVSAHGTKKMLEERAIEAAKMEWKSAATRLRIEQLREQIVEMATLNFDFISLLVIASILAGVGLITNNAVVIVASMLVSPMMGPVLGLTFGSRIHDWPLVRVSLANETLSLIGCVAVGAMIGICTSFTSLAHNTWPTNEMQIRGEPLGLITGIAIAIPSGMGVCLSVLGGNTSSLVGVAISASLLPPAVNAGICFVYSFLLAVGAVESVKEESHTAAEFAVIGAISFALTALNIICIWVAGLIMFEVKEVAPTKQKSAFWAKDIKIARELNDQTGSEKPHPVDIAVIQDGINAAIAKESKEHPEEKLIFRKKPSLVRGASKRERMSSAPNMEEAFHLSPAISITIDSPKADDGIGWADMVTTFIPDAPDDAHVRYLGVEDMGSLLGLDQEDGADLFDKIDHAAVATHIGKGRYI